jgi:hypothetical protein
MVCTRARGAATAWELREGHVRWCFVHTSLARRAGQGSEAMRPCGAHGHASTRCLGARKGRLRPGLNGVHARTKREEAATLPKTCFPAPCLWHRGGSQCSNGSTEAQRWRQQCEGTMRLDSGQQRGWNFAGGRCSEEQGKGDGFLRPNGHKQVNLRNGFRSRRSENDTRGPRGTGARLAATRGR